jgi:hypothetical protein
VSGGDVDGARWPLRTDAVDAASEVAEREVRASCAPVNHRYRAVRRRRARKGDGLAYKAAGADSKHGATAGRSGFQVGRLQVR